MNLSKCFIKLTVLAALASAAIANAADVLWRNTTSGDLGLWIISGSKGTVDGIQMLSRSCASVNGCSSAWKIVGTGNFFGDNPGAAIYAKKACPTSFACKTNKDILWHNPLTGELQIWFVDAAGMVEDVQSLSWRCGADSGCSAAWKAVGTGDFNQDGNTDVLWHNLVTGELGYWALDGNGVVLSAPLLAEQCGPTNGCSTDWKVVGTGDFNQDGFVDILWQHPSDNALGVWLMDGNGHRTSAPTISSVCSAVPGCTLSSVVVGVGDFNGDSHNDVLWYDPASGALTAWLLDGHAHVAGTLALSWHCDPATGCPSTWQPVGILRNDPVGPVF